MPIDKLSDGEHLITLQGGDLGVGEEKSRYIPCSLRIYINQNLEQPCAVEFKLKGADLDFVEGANPWGHTDTEEEMEMVRDLAEQINQKEMLTTLPCPKQLRKGNDTDLRQFKNFCEELDAMLAQLRQLQNNVFAFSNLRIPVPAAELVKKHLPSLRLIEVTVDKGDRYMITDSTDIWAFIVSHLRLIEDREKKQFGESNNPEEDNMSSNNVTVHNYAADATTVVGDGNHVRIQKDKRELQSILIELKTALELNSTADADEISALAKATDQDSDSPQFLQHAGKALTTAEKVVNTGTKLAGLLDKATSLYDSLKELL